MQTACFISYALLIAALAVGGFYLRYVIGQQKVLADRALGEKDATIERLKTQIDHLDQQVGVLVRWQCPALMKDRATLIAGIEQLITERDQIVQHLSQEAQRRAWHGARLGFRLGLFEALGALGIICDIVRQEIQIDRKSFPSPAFIEKADEIRSEIYGRIEADETEPETLLHSAYADAHIEFLRRLQASGFEHERLNSR